MGSRFRLLVTTRPILKCPELEAMVNDTEEGSICRASILESSNVAFEQMQRGTGIYLLSSKAWFVDGTISPVALISHVFRFCFRPYA